MSSGSEGSSTQLGQSLRQATTVDVQYLKHIKDRANVNLNGRCSQNTSRQSLSKLVVHDPRNAGARTCSFPPKSVMNFILIYFKTDDVNPAFNFRCLKGKFFSST